MAGGQMNVHIPKNKVGPLLLLLQTISSKWINNLNIITKPIKFIGHVYIFKTLDLAVDSNMAPKIQSIKEKLHKLDFIKSKNFSALKDIIKKEEITYKIGEIMVYHISDKGTVLLFTVLQRNRTNKE